MRALDKLCKPTWPCRAGLWGGVGLVSCCDIAIAVSTAFCPQRGKARARSCGHFALCHRCHGRPRRFSFRGDLFGRSALRLGLVHEVVPPEELEGLAPGSSKRCLPGDPKPSRRPGPDHQVAGGKPATTAFAVAMPAHRPAAGSEEGKENWMPSCKSAPAWRSGADLALAPSPAPSRFTGRSGVWQPALLPGGGLPCAPPVPLPHAPGPAPRSRRRARSRSDHPPPRR